MFHKMDTIICPPNRCLRKTFQIFPTFPKKLLTFKEKPIIIPSTKQAGF